MQCAAESENFFSGMGNGKILIEYKSLARFSGSARLAAQKLNEQQSVKSKKVFLMAFLSALTPRPGLLHSFCRCQANPKKNVNVVSLLYMQSHYCTVGNCTFLTFPASIL